MTFNFDNHKNVKHAPLPITLVQAELIFWLLAREVIFLSTFDNDVQDWSNHWYAVVNLNDTFYYATADAESVTLNGLADLKYYFDKYSWDGITAWASFKREGMEPVARLRTKEYYAAMEEIKDNYAKAELVRIENMEI
jgi:hypothetical protein